MGYYDEVIEEIRTALKHGDLEEAGYLLKKEFSMPYIPKDAEESLKELEKELNYRQSEKKEPTEVSLEKLLNMLRGKPQSQLRAADLLCERNLRAIAEEIRTWLSKDPLPEAAAIIMEGLAEQEVAEEFVYTKDGVEYTFFGDALTPVFRSEGFLDAWQRLQKHYMKEPSMKELAKTILIGKCFMALPVSYEKEEGEMLSEKVRGELEEAMNAVPKEKTGQGS